MSTDYVILGGGNFAVEVATYLVDIARAQPGLGIRVTDVVAQGSVRRDELGTILGAAPAVHEAIGAVPSLADKLCVIALGDAPLRYRFMQEVLDAGGRFGSVLHPTAYIAATATVGAGTIVCPLAFIGPFARVGMNCAINVHAVVGHDAVVGDCAVLSPGADINGYGALGEGGFLGAGAIISPKAALGAFGKLSAGSVLNRVTGEGFLMHGNPAAGRQMFRRP